MSDVSILGQKDADSLSTEHKIIYYFVACLLSLLAAVENIATIYCCLKDKKLSCCFNFFVANMALSELVFALTVMSLHTALFFSTTVSVCIADWALKTLSSVETTLLLLIITFDRYKLLAGVTFYRHKITPVLARNLVSLTYV